MERGIEHTTKQVDIIVGKLTFFKDERGGQVSVHHPDGTVKTEEFTDAELTALTESMSRHKTDVAARYPDMMRSMALIYLVAVFEGFLSDTLAEVLVSQ